MGRTPRITLWIFGGLLALTLVGVGAVYGMSELQLRKSWDVPLGSFSLDAWEVDLAEGERLARIGGCFEGCHGDELGGRVFFDEPRVARVVAPDLTRVVREYSDAELERVIRRGVRRDGRSVFAMPSPMYAAMADEELAHVIAFLRSWPELGGPPSEIRLGPLGRLGVAIGEFPPLAREIRETPPARVPRDDPQAWGRYLALTACSECHGHDLRGDPAGGTPGLHVAAAYSEADWARLLREGRGLGDRDLGLMSAVVRSRFRHLTDGEVGLLREYLAGL
jgi:mono/diheme cytochrome c family protein